MQNLDEMSPGPGLGKEIMGSSRNELEKETSISFESARSVVNCEKYYIFNTGIAVSV